MGRERQKVSTPPLQDPKGGEMLGRGQGKEDSACPPAADCLLSLGGVDLPVSPALFPSLCSHGSSVVAEPLCRACDSLREDLSAESADCRKRRGEPL